MLTVVFGSGGVLSLCGSAVPEFDSREVSRLSIARSPASQDVIAMQNAATTTAIVSTGGTLSKYERSVWKIIYQTGRATVYDITAVSAPSTLNSNSSENLNDIPPGHGPTARTIAFFESATNCFCRYRA